MMLMTELTLSEPHQYDSVNNNYIILFINLLMGNSSEKQRKKRCAESKFRWTIQEFLDRYGKLSKEQARDWVNKTYSDNLYSITKTNFAAPSTRKSKEELLEAF